jgi:4'-phosphopantetheinyl transferase
MVRMRALDTVDVAWHSAPHADEALRTHVASVVGADPATVRVGRVCPRCGSAAHGRPWTDHDVHVSVARSGPHLVTAVAAVPVGVDVESVASVDRAWEDLGLTRPAHSPAERAAVWCRIEAVAKLTGAGLTLPRDDVRLEEYDVEDVTAPDGFAAAVAVHRRDASASED